MLGTDFGPSGFGHRHLVVALSEILNATQISAVQSRFETDL